VRINLVTIIPATIEIMPESAQAASVNPRKLDMILHFAAQETGIECGDNVGRPGGESRRRWDLQRLRSDPDRGVQAG
jgi:hypothetical protein